MNFREPKFDALKILSLLWLLLSLFTEQILLFDYPNETPSWPHNLFQVDPFNSRSVDEIDGEQENHQIN